MYQGSDVPPGCCHVVLISVTRQILLDVPHGRIKVSGQRLPLLPITVTVLDGTVLHVAGIAFHDERGQEIVPALAYSGVSLGTGVEDFARARVRDLTVRGFQRFTSLVLKLYSR